MKKVDRVPSVIRNYLPEIVLLMGTVFWGGTYWAIHTALYYCPPSFFVGARFGVAALLTLCIFPKLFKRFNKKIVFGGIITGLAAFVGQLPQTWGLETVSISRSAFLTSLYVPIVPVVSWLIFRKMPALKIWIGIVIAFVGMTLLSLKNGFELTLTAGDWATLVSALGIAFEVVLISRFSKAGDAGALTFIQVGVCSLAGFLCMPVLGEHLPEFHYQWFLLVLLIGAANMFIQFSINWGQQYVSPSRAAVIYASEPVWGGLLGRMAGDRLGGLAILGGVLVIAGIIVSEWPDKKSVSKN